MKTAAIISEYNPFHNGHKYLNTAIKEHCADAVISIMSGSFTQRGDVAILSKFSRAKTALENGSDLVIELPVPYAVSNAQIFSENGVMAAAALGCVDYLCFGSECGDTEAIIKAARATSDPQVQEQIRLHMKKGDYYPRALTTSINELYGEETGKILAAPNNILGVEYCKALEHTDIIPIAFKRKGAEHDGEETKGNIASASKIRSMVFENKDTENYSRFTPETEIAESPVFFDMFDTVIRYILKITTPSFLASLPDVSEGLEHRILAAAGTCSSVQEIIEKVKTKRYTMARLRRIMVHLLLGVTKEIQRTPLPYIRVLGFNETGRKILSRAKDTATLPIIVKPSDSIKTLEPEARRVLEKDILATDIRELALKEKGKSGRDFTNGLIVI